MFALGASNQDTVRVNYLIGEITWPVAVVMSSCFLFGFCFAFVACLTTIFSLRWRLSQLNKQLTQLKKQQPQESQVVIPNRD